MEGSNWIWSAYNFDHKTCLSEYILSYWEVRLIASLSTHIVHVPHNFCLWYLHDEEYERLRWQGIPKCKELYQNKDPIQKK